MKYYMIKVIVTAFLILSVNNATLLASDELENIAPFDAQRKSLVPGESFQKRNQYWTSSVIQIDSTPFFSVSTRATSLSTHVNYDFFMNITGKSCRQVNILIFTIGHVDMDDMENQFGQITFDNDAEYNFRFLVKTFSGSNAIGFHTGDVDTLISLMKKSSFMLLTMPSIGKKIYYDLRGFTSSLQRAVNMCASGKTR